MGNEQATGAVATQPGISSTLLLWLPPLLASWVHGLVMYTRYPETVPVHWNAAGEVDRYGSRLEAAFGLPVIILLLGILYFAVLPRLMPREGFNAAARRAFAGMMAASLYFMLGVQILTSFVFLTGRVGIIAAIIPLLIVLLAVVGWQISVMQRNRV